VTKQESDRKRGGPPFRIQDLLPQAKADHRKRQLVRGMISPIKKEIEVKGGTNRLKEVRPGNGSGNDQGSIWMEGNPIHGREADHESKLKTGDKLRAESDKPPGRKGRCIIQRGGRAAPHTTEDKKRLAT